MKIKLTESQFNFIKEALGDDIPTYMRDIIKKRYVGADRLLQKDVPKHTDIIPNVKVEVHDENITNKTITELIEYFTQNIVDQFSRSLIYNLYYDSVFADRYSPMSPLANLLSMSLPQSNLLAQDDKYKYSKFIKNFTWLYSKEFRLPVTKDNDINKPIFSKNKSTLATFLKTAIRAFPNELNDIDVNAIITDKHFVGLREPIINYQTNIKKIKDSKLYLYITDRPDDKLRMSISLFYDSCQNIYTGGDEGTRHNKKLLSNVFDENSKVAYLIFNSPFKDKMGNDHPFTSIARTILRVNNEGGVMFDRVYPGDMEGLFYKIIEEKTGLKNIGKSGDVYHYKGVAGLPSPYMDRYSLKNIENKETDFDYVRLLTYITGYNPEDIEQISDNTFNVSDEEWAIYPYDQAIEMTRDFVKESFLYFYHKNDLIYILDARIVTPEDIITELGIDEYELEQEYGELILHLNIEFSNYLKGLWDIHTVQDLLNAIKNIKGGDSNRAHRWFENNIDLDNVIRYMGGETEAMSHALARYDGEVHEEDGYIIVRIDD
jgi:hypothetical protein